MIPSLSPIAAFRAMLKAEDKLQRLQLELNATKEDRWIGYFRVWGLRFRVQGLCQVFRNWDREKSKS